MSTRVGPVPVSHTLGVGVCWLIALMVENDLAYPRLSHTPTSSTASHEGYSYEVQTIESILPFSGAKVADLISASLVIFGDEGLCVDLHVTSSSIANGLRLAVSQIQPSLPYRKYPIFFNDIPLQLSWLLPFNS
jgi:hypothetical protein